VSKIEHITREDIERDMRKQKQMRLAQRSWKIMYSGERNRKNNGEEAATTTTTHSAEESARKIFHRVRENKVRAATDPDGERERGDLRPASNR
jgi:hypothetical protein